MSPCSAPQPANLREPINPYSWDKEQVKKFLKSRDPCRTAAALHIQEAWRRRQGNLILPSVSVCLRTLNAYPICLGRIPYIPFDIGTLTGGSGPS